MSTRIDKLAQFLELSRSLSTELGVEELCRSMAKGLMQTGLDRCSVVIGVQYDGGIPTVGEGVAVDDVNPELRDEHLHARHVTDDYPIIRSIVSSQEPALVNDMEKDERLSEREREFMLKLGILSAIVCPMVSRNRVTGYILAEKRVKEGFTEEDVRLYTAIASHAATAIEMARMIAFMELQVEERTRQMENFRGLAENAADAVCMATLQGHKIIYANPAYYTMHGYDENDPVIGMVDDTFAFYEESRGSTIAQITRQGGLRREHVHVRKDGTTFIGLDTVFAVRDNQDKPVALGSIIRDITRQKELEKRLRDLSERRTWQFEVITEIAQDIATAPAMEELFRRVVTLVKERFSYYHTHLYLLNEAGDTLDLAEGYGEPGRILKERGHRIPIGRGLVGTAARTERPVRVPDVTKQENWLPNPLLPNTRSEIAVPIKMGREVLGVLDVQSDQLSGLTEEDETLLLGLCGQIGVAIQNSRILAGVQRLVDERTREVAIFQALTENATYGVWMATPEGVISYANRASHRLFGYGYEEADIAEGGRELVGLFVNQLLTTEGARQFDGQLSQVLSGEPWQAEVEGLCKDSSVFDLLLLVFAIFDAEGNPIALAAINRDVTEQKELEEERERLNQEIINAHERLIRDLSAPLIPITENILVLPLIGSVDSVRAQQVMESMLQGIEGYGAQVVIVDITGVPVLDTSVANHLIRMTSAASLLGAKTVLVGIMPGVAQTLVELGVDLSGIVTRNNLQGGVEYALRTQGLHIAALPKSGPAR